MARQYPIDVPEIPQPQIISKVFEIEMITPMFGGGVEAKGFDSITPVRGPSIRGQLRFWWRATRGRKFVDVRSLIKREAEIWGSTSNASAVRIEVEVSNQGHPSGADSAKFPNYALFPFSRAQKESGLREIRFKLKMSFGEELESEIGPSISAWTNFGGLGSRTRRGCGALYCSETAPASESDLRTWWQDLQRRCGPELPSDELGWPQINTFFLSSKQMTRDAIGAWNAAINPLATFRQGIGVARNKGPGRSRWPEADSIRAHTGKGMSQHLGSSTLADPRNPGFPRASLGLPIVFSFINSEDNYPNRGILEPGCGDRMASPVILRPLKMKSGAFIGIALPLLTLRPEGLKYRFLEEEKPDWEIDVSGLQRHELVKYLGSPLQNLSPSGSAFKAFIKYLTLNGMEIIK